jgi:hypothetical protein
MSDARPPIVRTDIESLEAERFHDYNAVLCHCRFRVFGVGGRAWWFGGRAVAAEVGCYDDELGS